MLASFDNCKPTFSMTYQIPYPMPWDRLVGPLATAEDAVAKLDERLRTKSDPRRVCGPQPL